MSSTFQRHYIFHPGMVVQSDQLNHELSRIFDEINELNKNFDITAYTIKNISGCITNINNRIDDLEEKVNGK